VVSTPNRTHFEYVKRALESGKHGEFSGSSDQICQCLLLSHV
jgi:hypothetical protein